MIFDALKSSGSRVKLLDMKSNEKIDDDCMKLLGEYIKPNQYIEDIDIGSTNVSDEGVKTLTPYLDGNVTLKSLSFYGNTKITDKSIPMLIKMIESSNILDLGIDHTLITQRNATIPPLTCNIVRCGYDRLDFFSKWVSFLFVILEK